nr:tetratricopeptide repeat protein [uncultured Holophaga sp.]
MAMPDDPAALEQILEGATQAHMGGRLEEAAAGYGAILAQAPGHVAARHRLGVLLLQTGRASEAIPCFERALAEDPGYWRSRCSLGQALSLLAKPREALEAFRKVLSQQPGSPEAWMGVAGACRALGLGEETLEAQRRVAALRPGDPGAHNDLGVVLMDLGRPQEAVTAFCKSLDLQPESPLGLGNLGNALRAAGRLDEALEILRGAAARWPEEVSLWYNLGVAAGEKLLFSEAAEAYGRALALVPGHAGACNNLGNLLRSAGRSEEALALFRRVLAEDPASVEAANNAAAAAKTLGRLDEALALVRGALQHHPEHPVLHANLGNLLKEAARLPEALASYRRALELDPDALETHSNLAYAICFTPGASPRDILEENLRWARRHVRPDWGQAGHPNQPDPERRLRIGYVSPDFREHCQALFMTPLLACHDHERYHITCYASVPRPDATTHNLMGGADLWRDVAALGDAELAEQVRADGIDILVDLTMHMSSGRPLLFARKPAPVQVAWLAYPGTTGLAAMDYRLTDPYLDPPGEHDDWYAERSVRLPDTFWCYDPLTGSPAPGPLPEQRNGFITFGSLNNFCKVSREGLVLWAQVMTRVPDSRLLLLAPEGGHRQGVLDVLSSMGIAPERVRFETFRPRADYLALYREVDLGLDTLPYNGHTTSLDAFWMGVPVVTRLGATVVGRAGWSQLCNLGLRELAADDDATFVEKAVALATDLPRLSALRGGLRARMAASPLMDAPRFVRGLEGVYRTIWRRWCGGQEAGTP